VHSSYYNLQITCYIPKARHLSVRKGLFMFLDLPGFKRARALTLAPLLLVSACAIPQTQHAADIQAVPDSFAPVVKKVLPSVVNIAITETVSGGDVMAQLPPELQNTPLGREFRRRFGAQKEQVLGAGSGFVVDPSGIIVTNNHVVGHANRIMVGLSNGTHLPAHVIGTDDLTDVAVIKVDTPHPLSAVNWGNSRDVQVGDWIITAGNPFGLGGSISAGIVSAEGRDLGDPFDRFLQLDAPVNPGNSGGPAFNLAGHVIGMTTAIVSPSGGSVGIAFAIPSNLVRRIANQIMTSGSIARGWLGVAVEQRGAQSDEQGGMVAIAGITPGGPASRAGLRAGDQVVSVNGQSIESTSGLVRAIAEKPPSTTVNVTVRRNGREFTVPVTVGRRPPQESQ
jgi:serine protease Do